MPKFVCEACNCEIKRRWNGCPQLSLPGKHQPKLPEANDLLRPSTSLLKIAGPGVIISFSLERSALLKLTFTKSIGMLLLAIFLIAWGLVMLFGSNGLIWILLAILAIAAGIFILLGR